MPDVLISYVATSKYPQVELKALTEQGLKALAEAHGSKCSSITIAKRRLNYAKNFLKSRGCCLMIVNNRTSELSSLLNK